jgi:succinate dehydrogenase/fumarate reductase iron-sulfur protein
VGEDYWKITFNIARNNETRGNFFQTFVIDISPDEYVLDGIEKIWAFQDRSLMFRHACHHSTCGACGMLVNGKEKLTCITPIRSVTKNGGTLTIQPLRNFPIISDLVVDMGRFYQHLEEVGSIQVSEVETSYLPYEKQEADGTGLHYERLVDCIECGLCVSACPSSITSEDYYGPAALAAMQLNFSVQRKTSLFDLIDHKDGLWRCHSAYECTAVCPSFVDPSFRIMELRKAITIHRVQRLFHKK